MTTINTWNSNIPVELSKGGTNATSFGTATGIVKYDGTRLVTSTTATIDASNRYINTGQPFFLATNSGALTDVTGDGTVYTIAFDSEVADVGGNYNNGSYTFTAPVTGVYLFNLRLTLSGLAAAHTQGSILLTSTGGAEHLFNANYGAIRDVNNNLRLNGSAILYLSATNTVVAQVAVYNGTKVVDISGTAHTNYFSGVLLT